MTQDDIYAYASFTVLGGFNYAGDVVRTIRALPSHESAIDYAQELVDDGHDYATIIGVEPNGSYDLGMVDRIWKDGAWTIECLED